MESGFDINKLIEIAKKYYPKFYKEFISIFNNNKEAMEYFNTLYSMSDLAIIHGLRKVETQYQYKQYISIETILRHEIISIKNNASQNIYCVLGGGTVNVGHQFADSSIKIAELCQYLGYL